MTWMSLWLGNAWATPFSPALVLPGPEACDASRHLVAAMSADVEQFPRSVSQAAICDHTTVFEGSIIDFHRHVQRAVDHNADDPEALLMIWSGVGSLRSGLVGDAVRLATAMSVLDALEQHPDSAWLGQGARLAAHEPGPQPEQDARLMQHTLWERGLSVDALPLILSLPLQHWAGSSAQAALELADPGPVLATQAQAWWAVGSAHGIAKATASLHDDHRALQERLAHRSSAAR